MNAVTYKEFFPLLKDNKVWVGANEKGGTRKGNSLCFTVPDNYSGNTVSIDGVPMAQVSAWWFTNLDFAKRHEKIILWKEYTPEEYPKYDNYDAIECGHSDKIPKDYKGKIGVPISYLNGFYCPDQFEIVGISGDLANSIMIDNHKKSGRFYVCNKRMYDRIIIRRKVG